MTVETKGAETPDLTPDGTQEQTTETNQTQQPDEVTKRLEFLEREFKEVVKQRDEAKRKAREIEELKEKEKLETLQSAGKYEEANKELLRKLAEIEAEKESLLTIKEEHTIFVQEVTQELLNKLPESLRKYAQDFPLAKLREFVAEVGTQQNKVGTADAGRPGKGGIDISKVTFDDFLTMTAEQKETLAQKAPAKYAEFLRTKNKR